MIHLIVLLRPGHGNTLVYAPGHTGVLMDMRDGNEGDLFPGHIRNAGDQFKDLELTQRERLAVYHVQQREQDPRGNSVPASRRLQRLDLGPLQLLMREPRRSPRHGRTQCPLVSHCDPPMLSRAEPRNRFDHNGWALPSRLTGWQQESRVTLTLDPRADDSMPYPQRFLNPQGPALDHRAPLGRSNGANTSSEARASTKGPGGAWSACGLPQRSRLAVLGGQAAASAVPRQDRRVVEGRNLPRLPDPPPSRRRPTVRGWSCCPRHLSAVPCTEG